MSNPDPSWGFCDGVTSPVEAWIRGFADWALDFAGDDVRKARSIRSVHGTFSAFVGLASLSRRDLATLLWWPGAVLLPPDVFRSLRYGLGLGPALLTAFQSTTPGDLKTLGDKRSLGLMAYAIPISLVPGDMRGESRFLSRMRGDAAPESNSFE